MVVLLFLFLLVPLLVVAQSIFRLEALELEKVRNCGKEYHLWGSYLFAVLRRAPERPEVRVALVVVLEVVADHECLPAAGLLALVRPLVGVRAHVLLQVAPGGEELPAPFAVAIEGAPGVQAGVGVQAVQGGEGGVAPLHGAGEGLLAGVDAHVDLQAVGREERLVAVRNLGKKGEGKGR